MTFLDVAIVWAAILAACVAFWAAIVWGILAVIT